MEIVHIKTNGSKKQTDKAIAILSRMGFKCEKHFDDFIDIGFNILKGFISGPEPWGVWLSGKNKTINYGTELKLENYNQDGTLKNK